MSVSTSCNLLRQKLIRNLERRIDICFSHKWHYVFFFNRSDNVLPIPSAYLYALVFKINSWSSWKLVNFQSQYISIHMDWNKYECIQAKPSDDRMDSTWKRWNGFEFHYILESLLTCNSFFTLSYDNFLALATPGKILFPPQQTVEMLWTLSCASETLDNFPLWDIVSVFPEIFYGACKSWGYY